jgi:hypothetical protein
MELALNVLSALGLTLQEWNTLNAFSPQFLQRVIEDQSLSKEVKLLMLKVSYIFLNL